LEFAFPAWTFAPAGCAQAVPTQTLDQAKAAAATIAEKRLMLTFRELAAEFKRPTHCSMRSWQFGEKSPSNGAMVFIK
jgi:hypothetical protein